MLTAKLKFDRGDAVVTRGRLRRLPGIVLLLALAVCAVPAPAWAPYRGAGVIAETRPGAAQPHVPDPLTSLANVYYLQGKYGDAEELFKRTLAIQEATLGAGHPDVSTTLNNLAAVYSAQDKNA